MHTPEAHDIAFCCAVSSTDELVENPLVLFQLSALPLLSTAMQKLEAGHDTEVKVLMSEVELGVPQPVPL